MTSKVFLTAFTSLLFVFFPQNIIGCGPTEDPWDYYTSFFSRDNIPQKDLKPFYYTALLSFYDDNCDSENEDMSLMKKKIIKEWKQYCDNRPSTEDVTAFVFGTGLADIDKFIVQLKSGKVNNSAFAGNAMAKYLVGKNDVAAFSYFKLAKESEKLSGDEWSAISKKDSLAINRQINTSQTMLSQEKPGFMRNRFAFQLCKLAFYNRRFTDCIKWYDENFSKRSAVQELAFSYKAGSLYRNGQNRDAAYAFSKLFSSSSLLNKKDIFLGFLWSTDYCDSKLEESFLSLCKTDAEKATMIAMFAMHGTSYRLAALRKVYSTDRNSPWLPLLATREISKLEEKYLTPVLSKEKGGRPYYYSWSDENNLSEDKKQLNLTIKFFETLSRDVSLTNRGLYFTGIAYLHFICKNYVAARQSIERAKTVPLSAKLRDQLQLINLLLTANQATQLNSQTEQTILPSLDWLINKAAKDEEYKLLLRNFLTEILAQRYEQQKEAYKAALCYGLADKHNEWWNDAINFVHDEMTTVQLQKLYQLFNNKNASRYEKFLMKNSSITKNDVINTIGTSYLRDLDFQNAVIWLKRSTVQDTLANGDYNFKTQKYETFYTDPFYDYVNDAQRNDKKSPVAYTKLLLAQKLSALQSSILKTTDKETKAKLYYKLASALYNMSFYGNSWSAVDYYRHTSSWNTGDYKIPWEKEYYGVPTAKNYYQKAFELTANKEFKAACYFLVIKCGQRGVIAPGEYLYSIDNSPDEKGQTFWKKFKYSSLFGNFEKQFGDTKYYSYVYNRCSYLRDFVIKNVTK